MPAIRIARQSTFCPGNRTPSADCIGAHHSQRHQQEQNFAYKFSHGVLIPFDHSSHGCHALFAGVALQLKTISEQPK